MTDKRTPTQQLAHKRKLKAEQMARYRAARKTTHLTSDELAILDRALNNFAKLNDHCAQQGTAAKRQRCIDDAQTTRALLAKLTGGE